MVDKLFLLDEIESKTSLPEGHQQSDFSTIIVNEKFDCLAKSFTS